MKLDPKPKAGDTRIRKVFLFEPVYDEKLKKRRWLEWVTVKEKYYEFECWDWVIVEFLD